MKVTRSSVDTAVVTWLEHVTDEDYSAQGLG
jgi:hypothetical protein